jgi:hypothetical protein
MRGRAIVVKRRCPTASVGLSGIAVVVLGRPPSAHIRPPHRSGGVQ